MDRALNVADLRAMARRRLPRGVWEFLDRGVEDEICFDNNRAAFGRIRLLPRIFRDVSRIDTSARLFGREWPMPLAIAPTGGAGLFWYEGDLALARAAARHGTPLIVSSASTMNLEEIAAAGAPLWFQLYLWEDRALSHAVMERAHGLGCDLLFVTADIPVGPNREYNARNGFGTPFRLGRRNVIDVLSHPRWLAGVLGRYTLNGGLPRQANLPPALRTKVTQAASIGAHWRNDNLGWEEIKALRDRWPGRFIVKGVLRPDDAAQALAIGADGVVVSNHGGRSLDSSLATIDALPGIVDAVGGRLAIFIDSGVMRGTDVVKAIALGADMALAGRAAVYGLAAGGEAGVARAIALLEAEIVRTMAMTGSRSVAEITRDLIA